MADTPEFEFRIDLGPDVPEIIHHTCEPMERLEERGIMEWQAVVGLDDGELIAERLDAIPNPAVEVLGILPDGTEFKAVGSLLRQSGTGNSPLFRHRLMMRLAGKRMKRTKLIQTDKYVVAVEVEMVVPPDDPSEPCYESETVEFLRQVKENAERGDVAWLSEHGRVCAALESA